MRRKEIGDREVGAEGLGRINKDRRLAKGSPTLSAQTAQRIEGQPSALLRNSEGEQEDGGQKRESKSKSPHAKNGVWGTRPVSYRIFRKRIRGAEFSTRSPRAY
jgi:hypothetical protein